MTIEASIILPHSVHVILPEEGLHNTVPTIVVRLGHLAIVTRIEVSEPLFHPSISSRAILLVVYCWRLLTPGASRIKNSWGRRCELDILLHHRLHNLETIDLRVVIHVGVLGRSKVRKNHCPAVRLGTIAGASRAMTKFWGPGPVANFWGIDHEQVAEHAASTTIIRDLLSPVSQGKLDIWGNLQSYATRWVATISNA